MSQFKRIPYIPTSEKLADLIFSKVKRIQVEPKPTKRRRSDFSFYKTLYFRQFRFLFPEIESHLQAIVNNFPIIAELHPFHTELIDVLFGIERLQTSLSRINNTRWSIRSIQREVSKKLGNSESAEESKRIKTEAIGRTGSAIKKLKEPLNDLIEAKIQLSRLPDFNVTEKTIAFAGAPNAGKSSFVKLVSTGTPEIASYPFTTKELVFGHRKERFDSIQLLDTPGLLDRPIFERNKIEMRSILALKHLADCIIFLYDPTEDAPLLIEQQLSLHDEIHKNFPGMKIYPFINKIDAITEERLKQVIQVVGDHPRIATIESYKEQLEEIILGIIKILPKKELYYAEKLKDDALEHTGRSKKKDKIEWIFFDGEDDTD
ncbi:MAG: GTPase [Candidatus Heimdallarchaeota archaeon]